jgi:hypothetical protein
MKNLVAILFFAQITTCFGQNDKFTPQEMQYILSLDDATAMRKVDSIRHVIHYETGTFTLLELRYEDYKCDIHLSFDVVKKEGNVCVNNLKLYQKVSRNGGTFRYDKVVFKVGTKKDIKQDIHKTYEFYNQQNSDGSGIIQGEELYSIFSDAIENYKNVEFNYIIKSAGRIATRLATVSKIKASFSGILGTYSSLKNKYSVCEEQLISVENNIINTQGDSLCTNITMEYDAWEEDSTYYSSTTSQAILIKHIRPKETFYVLKLTGYGQTVNPSGTGITVELKNGSKIISQSAKINLNAGNGGHSYSSELKLSEVELKHLLNFPIVQFKIHTETTEVAPKNGVLFLANFNCVHLK